MKKLIFALCLFLSACEDKPTLQGQEFQTIQNGLEITLGFGLHDNRYYGKAINSYYGTYHAEGNHIHFSAPASTMYFADIDTLKQEEFYLDQLSQVQSYTLTHDTLTLTTSDKSNIIFQK